MAQLNQYRSLSFRSIELRPQKHCRMPRFVILIHDYPHLHWDLMLEPPRSSEEAAIQPISSGHTLWTWRLEEEPCLNKEIKAERLPNHRSIYLDYEGPVSDNRGTVAQWETGSYLLAENEGETLGGTLQGTKLNGAFTLSKTAFRLFLK